MLKVFQYNNATGKVELEDGNLLLIKEFRDLMDDNRNKCKQDPTGKKHLRALGNLHIFGQQQIGIVFIKIIQYLNDIKRL